MGSERVSEEREAEGEEPRTRDEKVKDVVKEVAATWSNGDAGENGSDLKLETRDLYDSSFWITLSVDRREGKRRSQSLRSHLALSSSFRLSVLYARRSIIPLHLFEHTAPIPL
jgi:hypothetical protein